MSLHTAQARAEARQADVQRQVDDESALQRLAALPAIEYDRTRRAEAKRLDIRPATLDQEVASRREKPAEPEAPTLFAELEPWPSPVDGAALLDALAASASRYLALPDYADAVLALWVVFTHTIEAAEASPILAVTAPEKRCGKTTLLDWLSRLVARALPASNITAAAMYRAVEKWKPTLLIDEADTFLAQSDELRGIINSGHTRRAAFVIRNVGDEHEPYRFSTWGAKAIAMIGTLKDTIADRSIHIAMCRKLPHERIESMRDAGDHFTSLARQVVRWSQDHVGDIKAARPAMPGGLHDREIDNWHTLIAIADTAGGDWPARARQAAAALSGHHDDGSVNTELLADIRKVFEDRQVDRITTAELIEALVQDDESPWPTYNRGKLISARQIGKRLRGFGVTVNQAIRIGTTVAKGYRLEQFSNAFKCYLPASVTRLQPSNGAALSDFASVTSDPDVTDEKEPKPSNGAACNPVTDTTEVY